MIRVPGYSHILMIIPISKELVSSAETGYFLPLETEPFQASAENNFVMFTTLSNLKNMNF